MAVNRRTILSAAAAGVAGAKHIAQGIAGAVGTVGVGVGMNMSVPPLNLVSTLTDAGSLYNHPLADAFRNRERRLYKMIAFANPQQIHPNVAAIKSYSVYYRALKQCEQYDPEEHGGWMGMLKKHLGIQS